MEKRKSLIDFVKECSKSNKDFDFYNLKTSLEVQKLHEALNNLDVTELNKNLIPSNFKSIRKGNKYGLECEIQSNEVKDIHHFKEELNNWNFNVIKRNKHIKVMSNFKNN